jgi:hypothetical protein
MNMQERYPQLIDELFCEEYDFSQCYTVLHPDGAYDELDVAVAIHKARGNISMAARLLKRSRRSVHNHILRSQLLSDWLEDIENEFLDTVEHGYRLTALSGDDVAARFFLTTKGKERGYVSRNETTGKDGGELLAPTVDWSKMDTESLMKIQSLVSVQSEDDD